MTGTVWKLIGGIIFSVFLALWSIPVLAQSDSLSLEGYWQLFDEVADELKSTDESSNAALEAIASHLVSVRTVELPGGELLPVDHGYLAGLLRSDPPQIELALDILKETRNLGSWHTHSAESSDLVALQQILSQSQFQMTDEAPNPVSEFFGRLFEGFLRLLARFFSDSGSAGGLFNLALTFVLGAGLITIFIFIYRAGLRSVIAEAGLAASATSGEHLTAEGAAVRAQEFSRQGDWRNAIRFLTISTILSLEARGLLPEDPTRTNREFLKSLRRNPELSAGLESITNIFDRVWYGFKTASEDDYAQVKALAEALKHAPGDQP